MVVSVVFSYSELPMLACPLLTLSELLSEQKPEPWIEKSVWCDSVMSITTTFATSLIAYTVSYRL